MCRTAAFFVLNLAVRIVTSRRRVNGNTGMVLVRDTSGLGTAGIGNTFQQLVIH